MLKNKNLGLADTCSPSEKKILTRSPIPLSRNNNNKNIPDTPFLQQQQKKIPDTSRKKAPRWQSSLEIYFVYWLGWQTRGPERQYTIRRKLFSNEALACVWLGPMGPHYQPLGIQSSPDSSHLLSILTTTYDGATASAHGWERTWAGEDAFILSNIPH